VAQALKGVTPVARYWEAFDARDGRRYVAFIQVKLAAADAAKLIESYTTPQTAMGATVLTYFPGLAWKYPKVTRGAIVVSLSAGSIQELGVAEKSVVLSIDGRDTPDAAAFAKIIVEERELLAERGGSLRILVQADSGDPREFSQTIAGRPIEIAPSGKYRGNGKDRGGPAGGVNVWDRFGGNKGSGRDDPTQ
jgi:hypothetical protein